MAMRDPFTTGSCSEWATDPQTPRDLSSFPLGCWELGPWHQSLVPHGSPGASSPPWVRTGARGNRGSSLGVSVRRGWEPSCESDQLA